MNNIFENFTKCYGISKTLRFKLIPVGKTLENVNKYGILKIDEEKAECYPIVKKCLDKYHKQFIETKLSNCEIDFKGAFENVEYFCNHKDEKKSYDNECKKYQKEISKYLKNDSDLTPKTMINEMLYNTKDLTETEVYCLDQFDGFSTYFEGYRINRENLYSDDGASSIAFRIIKDNLPKYYRNIKSFNKLPKSIIEELNKELKDDGIIKNNLSDYFVYENYTKTLSQSQIEEYNKMLSGYSLEDGSKVKGLNEYMNLLYQAKRLDNKTVFETLYKQLLSDTETESFIIDTIDSDEELKSTVKAYCEKLEKISINDIKDAFYKDQANKEKVYVDKNEISVLSQIMFDNNWGELLYRLNQEYKVLNEYTISQIEKVSDIDILELLCEKVIEKKKEYDAQKAITVDILNNESKIENFDSIKALLDSIQEIEKLLKIVSSDEIDRDPVFYSDFEIIHYILRENINVYNKVRNYASKKAYSEEKYKLNFNCPTLANGWDRNKEYENQTIILRKDNNYYLGIINKKSDIKCKLVENDKYLEGAYEKMVYKLLPGPNKMLPKVFLSSKGIETYHPSEYIISGYNDGKHLKNSPLFDKKYLHSLIDYFKESIKAHPDWSKFDFTFSKTEDYEDISAFYREIEKHNYSVKFVYVPVDSIDENINNGSLFLFQIYNKDFSLSSTGNKNLHTLYWNEVFSDKNLKEAVFKLNGGAELFYRPRSINNPFIHKKGSIIVKKTDENGNSYDETIIEEAIKAIENNKPIMELNKMFPTLNFRECPHDIIKDKRYCEDQFMFHVPISINNTVAKYDKFNSEVLKTMANSNCNIIGIDRGERNLLYVSCIDQKGNILEQKSLNIINNIDYHKKLDELEKQRDFARKNWKNIKKIAETKEGYLSLVVHEVATMMIKYNAVLVLEDLNFGFKRGRFHIEKQVYQKFEKALIEKLNYLVIDKGLEHHACGGIANGYQLTSKFESFEKLGKQSGFLFYIPARYTSKIDPVTGFVNLFNSKHLSYESVEKSKAFFKKFDFIRYNKEYNDFEFAFKYKSFGIEGDYNNSWIVSSADKDRIGGHINSNNIFEKEIINVSSELIVLFNSNSIDYKNEDLKEKILNIDSKSFFSKLLYLFRLIVTIRHEDENNDYILSPIRINGEVFDSRYAVKGMPIDGDANGAYHIALQGLRLVKNMIQQDQKGLYKINADKTGKSLYNWLEFVQCKKYINE